MLLPSLNTHKFSLKLFDFFIINDFLGLEMWCENHPENIMAAIIVAVKLTPKSNLWGFQRIHYGEDELLKDDNFDGETEDLASVDNNDDDVDDDGDDDDGNPFISKNKNDNDSAGDGCNEDVNDYDYGINDNNYDYEDKGDDDDDSNYNNDDIIDDIGNFINKGRNNSDLEHQSNRCHHFYEELSKRLPPLPPLEAVEDLDNTPRFRLHECIEQIRQTIPNMKIKPLRTKNEKRVLRFNKNVSQILKPVQLLYGEETVGKFDNIITDKFKENSQSSFGTGTGMLLNNLFFVFDVSY